MDLQIEADLDQADEDILTCTVSDEALEAAAGTSGVKVYASSPHGCEPTLFTQCHMPPFNCG
jgi:hypothetical protein